MFAPFKSAFPSNHVPPVVPVPFRDIVTVPEPLFEQMAISRLFAVAVVSVDCGLVVAPDEAEVANSPDVNGAELDAPEISYTTDPI